MKSQENKSDISINSNHSSNSKIDTFIILDIKQEQELRKKELSGKKLCPILTEKKKIINFFKDSTKTGTAKKPGNLSESSSIASFNPEKEFEKIIARYEAKKLEKSSKFQESEEEIEFDSSTESLIERETFSKIYGPYQSNFHLNKKSSQTQERGENLRATDILEPKPGTSKMKSDIDIPESNAEEIRKSNFFKIDNPFSDFSLKNIRLNRLEVENECEIAEGIRKEMQLQNPINEFSEIKDESNATEDEDDNNLMISWSSSDLVGITRWNIPKPTVVSDTIINHLSLNYVLDSVVNRFINVGHLAPVIFSQKPSSE